MATRLAEELKVPQERFAAFAEVFEAQGDRGARRWDEFLGKVRSSVEVEQRITERPELLAELKEKLDERSLEHARQRLIFCGRYSQKVKTPLDQALDFAVAGISAAVETRARLGGSKMRMIVAPGRFGDDHLTCRGNAFPYRPSVSASHGSSVIEARAEEDTDAAKSGTLLGYVAMQGGGYIDDLGVEPKFQGQSVATALLAAAAAIECQRGGSGSLSLDVRAANVPAIKCYEALGFKFGDLQHPGFLDWDGGYDGQVDASVVKAKLPASADISKILR